jgi:hypothetical protein
MKKVKFITTASNQDHPGLQKLLRSLDQFGWDVVLLIAPWRGYASKFIETYNYLKSGAEKDTDLIVYSDSYDSLVLCSPEEVLQKYLDNFSPKVLYYAERACWPHGEWESLYPKVENTPYKHLNGGGFIGTPKQYMDLVEIEFPEFTPQFNDQVHSTKLFLHQNDKANIALDNYCKIFQCFAHASPQDFRYEDGRVINNITREKPCFIHFNGHCVYERIVDLQVCWEDTKESHKEIAEMLAHKTNQIPQLKAHRDFVESNSFGFGERPFVYMHKLMVDEMPEEFSFMEIGVYKGAILSLYRLLADMQGKKVWRYGVTPLSTAGNFAESDFEKDIKTIHDQFGLEKDYTILKGLSTDYEVITNAAMLDRYDILYIDGGHDYETVSSDLKHYTPLINPRGLLVIDDCANDLDLPENYFFGIESVTKALKDFDLPSKGFEFLFSVGHNKVYRKK